MSEEIPDHALVTYREIALRFGLSGPNAARTKVKRAGWDTEPPNHPSDALRIRVPRDAWDQATESPDRTRRDPGSRDRREGASRNGNTQDNSALEMALKTVREQLEHERGRAGVAEARVRELTEQIADLRVGKAVSDAKAEVLQAQVDRLTEFPGAALLARLRAAWRRA